MTLRLLYSFFLLLPLCKVEAQDGQSIEKIFNRIPVNSSFQNIIEYLNNSNCFYANNLDSTLREYNLIEHSYLLKKECIPLFVDSATLIVYKGIRGKRIRKTKYARPINITDLEMKFYSTNSKLIDSIYSRLWDSLKSNKTNFSLVEVGVDSSTARYIDEQKLNKKGIKHSQFSLIKGGIPSTYLSFGYRRDD